MISVLVVDDSVVVRRLITDALADDPGIRVIATAPNGRVALQKIDQLKPDLVTLDIEMPVLDGLEALPLLRERAPDAHVVVWSSHPDWMVGPRATALGADAVLRKTASFAAVREALLAAARGEVTPS